MKLLFEKICKSKTPTEKCKDFNVIRYKDLSPDKATRLSKIDKSLTPEPYILEVVEKIDFNINKHKVYSFNNKQQAIEFQDNLI